MKQIEIPQRNKKGLYFRWAGLFLLAVIMAASYDNVEIDFGELFRNRNNTFELLSGFFPPSWSNWTYYLEEMILTVQIAVWGTVSAVILAVPFGLLCAENIMPQYIVQPARRLMDILRAINEMVFAMLFVVAVGFGPFAGILALVIHTIGGLAKLFSEAVEAIDPRPVEGVRATGAHPLSEIQYGIIPQVLPLWISFSLYRFESNVRAATVLGIVGAGGIGQVLYESIRGFDYDEACTIMIIIVLSVTIIDYASSWLRRKVI